MAEGKKRQTLGLSLVLLSGVCWALTAVMSKVGIELGLSEYEINTVRTLVAAAFLAFFVLFVRRTKFRISAAVLALVLLLGAIDFGLGGVLFIASLRHIDASMAFLLVYTYPAMVVLISVAIGREKPRPSTFAALVLTFIGVALVLEAGWAIESEAWIGIAFVAAAALIFSVYIVACEWLMDSLSSSQVAFLSLAGGGIAMLLVVPFSGFRMQLILQPRNLLVLALLAVVGTAFSMILFLMGMRHIGASRAAIFTTVEPVFVVLMAWMILGEVLSPVQMAGVLLQMSGLAISHLKAPAVEPGP
jgi:drug/metabolite transporter (DMT)-like permease